MKEYGEVVGVVGGVELGDVEQAPAAQAIVEVAGVKGRLAIDVELARYAVDSVAIDVDLFDGRHCHQKGQAGQDERKEGGEAGSSRRHGEGAARPFQRQRRRGGKGQRTQARTRYGKCEPGLSSRAGRDMRDRSKAMCLGTACLVSRCGGGVVVGAGRRGGGEKMT